jgi:hypothetical protein
MSQGCCSSECEDYDKADWMLHLAHKAKKQLLLEKMKAELEKRKGAQLSKKAAAVVDAMIAEWEADQEAQKRHEKLLAAMG